MTYVYNQWMDYIRTLNKRWLSVLFLTVFFGLSARADIRNEIKNQGLLCEDGLNFCDYFERDHSLLLKKGPGSYFFRNLYNNIIVLYLGTDGLLRFQNLKYEMNGSLQDLTSELAHILKHPVKTKSFCGAGVETLPHNGSSPSPSITPSSVSPSAHPLEHNSDQKPFYCHQDAVFSDDGSLKVKGTAVYEEDAQEKSQTTLDLLQLKQKQLHGAQLFHGSTSASLTAFTEYNAKEGALLPLGILENEKKKIAFSGEIVWGRTGVNASSLSTTWAGELTGAMTYAHSEGWSPAIGKSLNAKANKNIKEIEKNFLKVKELEPELRRRFKEASKAALKTGNFSELKIVLKEMMNALNALPGYDSSLAIRNFTAQINAREVNDKRLSEWKTLTKAEKNLISKPFPVLYGIRSERKDDIQPVFAAIRGEIAIKGGVHAGEIRVVFVPFDKVEFVKNLLSENGHAALAVEPIPHSQ
jgi:hypothetical protein